MGLDAAWPVILGQLITLMALVALHASLAWRRLLGRRLPAADMAAMLLSPFAAIRAPRLIWREFFSANSPASIGRLLRH
jgi:hypothetical protein